MSTINQQMITVFDRHTREPLKEVPASELSKLGRIQWEEDRLEQCRRCGGAGGFKGWPGFTCYECGGECKVVYHYRITGYTLKRIEQLEAADERRAEKARKIQAQKDAEELQKIKHLIDPVREALEVLEQRAGKEYRKACCGARETILGSWYERCKLSLDRGGYEMPLEKWLDEKRAEIILDIYEKHKAEQEQLSKADPIEEGRQTIIGEVLGFKEYESQWGTSCKMIVKAESGNKFFGTVPSTIDPDRGDVVKFDAAVTQSKDDIHFGFYSRPTKAEIIEEAASSEEGGQA